MSKSRRVLYGLPRTTRKAKYGNRKVTLDGITFDSKREAARWMELQALQRDGKIKSLRRQVPFALVPAVVIDGRKKPAVRYVADFVYIDESHTLVVEDCKGYARDAYFRLKRHLLKHVLGLDLTIT